MFDERHSKDELAAGPADVPYDAVMAGSAIDVAAAIRDFQPLVPRVKLQKLLYYCQGHHLAATGEALFVETISAYDMGPVVGALWRAEKDKPGALDEGDAQVLSEAQLNTVGYVMHHYGSLNGRELTRLSHAEPPWQEANRHRPPGGRATITPEAIRSFFAAQEAAGEAEELLPEGAELDVLTSGAVHRRDEPARRDSIVELRRRMANLRQ